MIYLRLLFIFFIITQASAAELPANLDPCKIQIDKYCQEELKTKDLRSIIQCLKKVDPELTNECKQEIQRFAQASRQTTPIGSPLGGIAGLAGPATQVPTMNFTGRFLPSGGGAKSPLNTDNNLTFSVPVHKDGRNTYAVTATAGQFHFNESIPLDSGRSVPTDFYRTEAGLSYSRNMEGRNNFGIRFSAGYAGDKFVSNTQSFNLNANYAFPSSSKEGIWVASFMLSNLGPFGEYVPVPGLFYIYKTQTFTGIYGFPVVSIQWTPVNPWSYSFSMFGPIIKSEVAYGAIDRIQYFLGIGWQQQRFLTADREEKKDRLTVEEKYAEIGLRTPLSRGIYSEFQLGYAFDRKVYEGKGLFDMSSGSAELESNGYIKYSIRAGF